MIKESNKYESKEKLFKYFYSPGSFIPFLILSARIIGKLETIKNYELYSICSAFDSEEISYLYNLFCPSTCIWALFAFGYHYNHKAANEFP